MRKGELMESHKPILKELGPLQLIPCNHVSLDLCMIKNPLGFPVQYSVTVKSKVLTGHISEISKVTLSAEGRAKAKIPKSASHFLFAYPMEVKDYRELPTPEEKFLAFGGFVYLDSKSSVVGVNAIDDRWGGDLVFYEPLLFSPDQKTKAILEEKKKSVYLPELKTKHIITHFCWLPPGYLEISEHGAFMYWQEPQQLNASILIYYFKVKDSAVQEDAPFIWEYKSKHNWIAFDLQTIHRLEEGFAQGKEKIYVKIMQQKKKSREEVSYSFNFKELKRYNQNTKTEDSIRRTSIIQTRNYAKWDCLVNKAWVPYSDAENTALEKYFQGALKGDRGHILTEGKLIQSNTYSLDFVKMVQTNVASGFDRNIRRLVPSSKLDVFDEATLKSPAMPSHRSNMAISMPKSGELTISVIKAENLGFESSDPYIVVMTSFSPFYWRSSTKKTCSPAWNETFFLTLSHTKQEEEISFSFYDQCMFKKDLYLGKWVIKLSEIIAKEKFEETRQLTYECAAKRTMSLVPATFTVSMVFYENKGQPEIRPSLKNLIKETPLPPLPALPRSNTLESDMTVPSKEDNQIYIRGKKLYVLGAKLDISDCWDFKSAKTKEENFVIVKVVPPAIMNDEYLLISNEIKILNKIDSPYCVKLIDRVFEKEQLIEDSPFYLIYDPFRHNLFQLVHKKIHKVFKNQEKHHVFLTKHLSRAFEVTVNGLHYLHNNYICHRNITPKSIWLGYDGIWKLSCFEHAVDLGDEKEKEVAFPGQFEFRAPEVLSGKKSSFSMDMWSFGVTVYYCFEKGFPFQTENDIQILLNPENDVVLNYVSDIPPIYKEMISSLILVDVHKRWNIDHLLKFVNKMKN